MPDRRSYTWLAARARNALRRRAATSIIAGIAFVAALIGLVLIPQQATRTARTVVTQNTQRPDTTVVLLQQAHATAAMARADSALVVARRVTPLPPTPPPIVDTLAPALKAERDSLDTLLTLLNGAMTQAADAPLPPAFRALAQTPALRDDPNVHVLLDSLDQVDKLREPFGALGAGDPIYVALTARVNELGRSIRDAATLKRSELRARIAPLLPPPAPPPPITPARVDTVPIIASRAAAQREYTDAARSLTLMRAQNSVVDSTLAHARELANIGAPPLAMLAAALVIALVIGFSSAFAEELKHPRLANTREAEVVSGTRVLAVIRPTEVLERSRRQSDVTVPPLIDIVSESYRTIYLHLAAIDASIPMVTVAGDIPQIVATVASNLAAVAAYEARNTVLIDVDTATNSVASVLRVSPNPGLAGILFEKSDWATSVVSTTIGRNRPLEILPAGTGRLSHVSPATVDQFRNDLTRMERRYDFIVIAAPRSYIQQTTPTIIPAPDTVLCARIGETRLADIRAAVKNLRSTGRNVHGIVLWDDEIPRL